MKGALSRTQSPEEPVVRYIYAADQPTAVQPEEGPGFFGWLFASIWLAVYFGVPIGILFWIVSLFI